MVEEGLHIGLAAWIDAQREGGGFPVWPALPFATRLVHLEDVQTMHDLVQASEFSRMVNFVPRLGRYAESFVTSSVIWEIHRDLLERMIFAVRAWTLKEDADWKAARATLYDYAPPNGLPTMTQAFRLYDEYRIAYADLLAATADPAELAAAHASWIAVGHKLEIEAALATINRLAQRSSLPEAEAERLALEQSRLLATGDASYAPTAFSPLSAVSEDNWLSAETTIEELEHAIGDAEPRAKWAAWRVARSGSVQFHYAILDIRRPWFTRALYEADDWRLDDESTVSKGDGVGGELPAFVASVYCVKIDELRTGPKPLLTGSGNANTPVASTIGQARLLGMSRRSIGNGLSLSQVPREGVMATASTHHFPVPTTAPVVTPMLAQSTRVPSLQLREAPFGRVERVGISDFLSRLLLADAVISGQVEPDNAAASSEIYVVGFGCTRMPTSPLPNPGYQWTTP
jgi:hypothetical protein